MRILPRHLAPLLFCALIACDDDAGNEAAVSSADRPAVQPQSDWVGSVSEVYAVDGAKVDAKFPGADDFSPVRARQPLPPGTVLQTVQGQRAEVRVPEGTIILGGSTVVTLGEGSIEIRQGRAVFRGREGEVQAKLGGGSATLSAPQGRLEALLQVRGDRGEVRIASGVATAGGVKATSGDRLIVSGGEFKAAPADDIGRAFDWANLGVEEDPWNSPGIGTFEIVGSRGRRLELASHRVAVELRGPVATTQITETFSNKADEESTAAFTFHIPPGAEVTRVSVAAGDEIYEGEYLPARESRPEDSIATKWGEAPANEPGLGKPIRLGIQLPPGANPEVLLQYTERLETTGDGYEYTLPMANDTGRDRLIGTFEFEAAIIGHQEDAAFDVIGYPVETKREDRGGASSTTVSLGARDFFQHGDLTIEYASGGDEVARAYAFEDSEGSRRAIVTLRPKLPSRTPKPRDFVLVVDRSGSMSEEAIELNRGLVTDLLYQLGDEDRAMVLACSAWCEAMGVSKLSPATTALADKVRASMKSLEGSGVTYPAEALRVVAKVLEEQGGEERETHLLFFGDGGATLGEIRPRVLEAMTQKLLRPFTPRITMVTIDRDQNHQLLEAIARGGSGSVVQLDPTMSSQAMALDLIGRHSRALLAEPTVELEGAALDSAAPVSLSAGEELVLAITPDQPKASLKLQGILDGEAWSQSYEVDLDGAPTSKTVGPLWAQAKIRKLQREESPDVAAIVDLSSTWRVDSAFTRMGLASATRGVGFEDHVRHNFELPVREPIDVEEPPGKRVRNKESDETALREKVESYKRQIAARKREAKQRDYEQALKDGKTKEEARKIAARKERRREAEAKKEGPPGKAGPLGGLSLPFLGGKGMDQLGEAERKVIAEQVSARTGDQAPGGAPSGAMGGMMGAGAMGAGMLGLPGASEAEEVKGPPPKILPREAAAPTTWEIERSRTHQSDLARSRGSREARARAIASQIRAHQFEDARKNAEAWTTFGSRDPEPLVYIAETSALYEGTNSYFDYVLDALEQAPQTGWLVEWALTAARTDLRPRLTCALEVQKAAMAGEPADILRCPLMTNVEEWSAEADEVDPSLGSEKVDDRGQLSIALTPIDSTEDFDLVVIEPSGQMIWWGAPRENARPYDVRGARTERLVIPRVRKGTYSILAVSKEKRTVEESQPATLKVAIDAGGKTATFNSEMSRETHFVEVAEVQFH